MEYRQLGRSGMRVSEIALGSWLTYGASVDMGASEAVIDTAYSTGINFFDTANAYHRGVAEQIMGSALRKSPRPSFVLATKVFSRWATAQTMAVCRANILWNSAKRV